MVEESIFDILVNSRTLQRFEDTHGDFGVMSEDEVNVGCVIEVNPVFEKFSAFRTAPTGGVEFGNRCIDVSICPAVVFQCLLETGISHLRNGREVTGDDEDFVADFKAVFFDKSFRGQVANLLIIALDGGNCIVDEGVDDTVNHNEGNVCVRKLSKSCFDRVVIRQNDDRLVVLVCCNVLYLGNLVCSVTGSNDLRTVSACRIDFRRFLLCKGHNCARPAVVCIGNEDCDITAAAGVVASCERDRHRDCKRCNNDECHYLFDSSAFHNFAPFLFLLINLAINFVVELRVYARAGVSVISRC